MEAYVEGEKQRSLVLSHLLTYCVLHEALGLEICENAACVLNNCDSVGEAEQISPYLCATCMRVDLMRVPVCRMGVLAHETWRAGVCTGARMVV